MPIVERDFDRLVSGNSCGGCPLLGHSAVVATPKWYEEKAEDESAVAHSPQFEPPLETLQSLVSCR